MARALVSAEAQRVARWECAYRRRPPTGQAALLSAATAAQLHAHAAALDSRPGHRRAALGACSRTTKGLLTATAPGRKVEESLAISLSFLPHPCCLARVLRDSTWGPTLCSCPPAGSSHPEVGPRVDGIAPAGQFGNPNLPSIGAERPAESAGRAEKA